MKYALLIYASEQDWANQTEEASQAQFQEYMAFTKDIVDRGLMRGGEALQPIATATTVRVRDGETLTTDGPFAETKEQLGGFYLGGARGPGGGRLPPAGRCARTKEQLGGCSLVEAKDLDEATEIAGRIPDVRRGSIEV